MDKHHHILNAASNLLGISLVIIAGLKVSGHSGKTLADEVACVAALCFGASCLLSYGAIRTDDPTDAFERWADRIFLVGLFAIIASVAIVVVETA